MPLGLTNVLTIIQCIINSCFYDILDEFIFIYIDNLLIYSKSKAKHKVHLCYVFDHLCEETLLNLKNANLEKTQLNILVTFSGRAMYVWTQAKYRQ